MTNFPNLKVLQRPDPPRNQSISCQTSIHGRIQTTVSQTVIMDNHCYKPSRSALWQKQWPPGFVLHKSGCSNRENHLPNKLPAAAAFFPFKHNLEETKEEKE